MAAKTILGLDAIVATDVAAGDLAALWDATAGFTKKIDANALLEALLRVVPSGILNLIPARTTFGTVGYIGQIPLIQIPGVTATTEILFMAGVLDAGVPKLSAVLWKNSDNESFGFDVFDGNGNGIIRLGKSSANPSSVLLSTGAVIGWSDNSSIPSGSTPKTGIARLADKVLAITDGQNGNVQGWVQTGGLSRVNDDVTNATTTMANVTGLSATLIAGRKYAGKLILYVNDSLAADGLKVDFDGGTATMTSFRAHGTVFDTALLLSTQTTALATDFTAATITGDAMVEVYFSLVCNAAGTFIPRFAQNAHTTGTATVYLNSHMKIDDMP